MYISHMFISFVSFSSLQFQYFILNYFFILLIIQKYVVKFQILNFSFVLHRSTLTHLYSTQIFSCACLGENNNWSCEVAGARLVPFDVERCYLPEPFKTWHAPSRFHPGAFIVGSVDVHLSFHFIPPSFRDVYYKGMLLQIIAPYMYPFVVWHVLLNDQWPHLPMNWIPETLNLLPAIFLPSGRSPSNSRSFNTASQHSSLV